MVWWQTLVIALASSVVGGVLSVAGSVVLSLQQQRARRREQTAETIAMTLTALREIDPEVYEERLRFDDRGRELIADKRARWLEAVGRLELLGALHPESEIADLTASVIKKGGLVLIRLDERVGASSQLSDAWLKAVPEQHRGAVADAQRLARLVAD